ncbi:MAG: DciA family protein [Acidimicrobiales bacterium]|jgi:predicted nucleic acid-binding Zn ribbon protein
MRSALDNLASTLGLTNVDSINALFVDWPEIVGEQLAKHCVPRSLRDQVLTIEASDQQWATELKWMTSLLIERCCDALGLDAVTEVRIIR